MTRHVVELQHKHLEQAAGLACRRYQNLREQVPSLPPRYANQEALLPMLVKLVDAGPAVAAFQQGRLVGFMTAWLIPSFRGLRSVISPELGNAAELGDSARIYEQMYAHIAAAWVADGYTTHLVGMLANDRKGIEAWRWLGFGMFATDAIRDLAPVAEDISEDIEILRADTEHLEAILQLEHGLAHHLAASPVFLVDAEPSSRDEGQRYLKDRNYAYWLALRDNRPVAYLRIGPASEDASTIIYDEETASVTGAFTEPAARGGGVAAALLDRALAWARKAGYIRCAVDFEPMNPQARRFWLRHFTEVCSFYVRHIDRRAVSPQS